MRGFIPAILLLLVIAFILRVNFLFTVVYFLAGLYLLAHIWVRRSTGHLQVERRFTDRAFAGDYVQVRLTLRNTGWLPVPWLRIHESTPVQLLAAPFQPQVLTLGPHDQREYTYALNCRTRGYYRVGPLIGEAGDLLGLDSRPLTQLDPQRLIVYPKIVSMAKLGLSTLSPLVSLPAKSRLFEDPSRIMGVRDYQRGDSMRRIHWSASARARQLVVKQYQPAIARETMVFLDLNSEHFELRRQHDAVEKAIIAAASISNHIITREGLAVGLAAEGVDPLVGEQREISIPPRSERAHLIANILEVLARVQSVQGTQFTELLQHHSAKLSWGTTIVAITGNEDEELLKTMLHLQRSGFAVSLILVRQGLRAESLEQQASIARVPVHTVWDDRDMEVLQ